MADFQHFTLNELYSFSQLTKDLQFEQLCKGRQGCNLYNPIMGFISIVRTTTEYQNPSQKFRLIHYQLMESIKQFKNVDFNNALTEIYTSQSRKMKFHTDQTLDLLENSWICLYSCYEQIPENQTDLGNLRSLIIQEKGTDVLTKIPLYHNSIVMFSVATNKRYLHKIISEMPINNKWLGITFRMSKTLIEIIDEIPYFAPTFPHLVRLRLATEEERKEFMKYKGAENLMTDFSYPTIDYTLNRYP